MLMKDRTALITGAAQGIGRACAERFVAEGAKVIVVDIYEPDWISASSHGGKVFFRRCDVGNRREVENLFAWIAGEHPKLDTMLNNAGLQRAASFLELSEDDYDEVLRVCLKSVFLCSQAAARLMMARGTHGTIINMSSINATVASLNNAAYCAAKGGVSQLTRAAALSLAPYGIRVNAIGPGTIATEMAKRDTLSNEASRASVISRTPLGRLGEPHEIASIAVFLAADASSYITGQTIFAEGGRLALNLTMPDR
ncbi:MAG: SDR family NAD(P)-dependent oxidoreductase [Rhizobiaceae bacterium]|jgi:NAD(P)-dependent dehydrogenase (short-subunit alcohol dehydrogenase family)